ncbi:MAG: hypothetical protein GX637_08990 [Clostridiales bacterium]|nr:hypothetical protein [Clostridiales bacterium]
MLPCHRLYIASVDADHLERIFAFDPGFFVVGSGQDRRVTADIIALCPDAVVMDSVLSGEDGPAVLARLAGEMPAPPRVLYLQRTAAALPAADASCPYPCEADALLSACRRASGRPLPLLADAWALEREAIAQGLIKRLGMPEGLKGTQYLKRAVAWCACAPGLCNGKRLYALLAEAFGATPAAVEKAMRTAIEHTWLHGDLQEIQALFGLSVDADRGKPTNNECVAMLSEHTRRALRRSMLTARKGGKGEL